MHTLRLSEHRVKPAFLEALHTGYSLMLGILFLGIGYGVYAKGCGFDAIYPIGMATFIFAGSMEFICIELLLGAYNPLYALLLTLVVNGRHLFYGLSIFEKYKDTGWKKFGLVSGLIDESFSVNYITQLPPYVDRGWFMLFITLSLYVSWISGTVLGTVCGDFFTGIKGIEFVMPSLFIVIFISQWQKESSHTDSLMGIIMAAGCLWLFGKAYFLLPSLLLFSLWGSVRYHLSVKHNKLKP